MLKFCPVFILFFVSLFLFGFKGYLVGAKEPSTSKESYFFKYYNELCAIFLFCRWPTSLSFHMYLYY